MLTSKPSVAMKIERPATVDQPKQGRSMYSPICSQEQLLRFLACHDPAQFVAKSHFRARSTRMHVARLDLDLDSHTSSSCILRIRPR